MSEEKWRDSINSIRNDYLFKKQDIDNRDYIKGGLSEYAVSLLTINKDNGHVILHIINNFNITFYLDFPLEIFKKRFNKINI